MIRLGLKTRGLAMLLGIGGCVGDDTRLQAPPDGGRDTDDDMDTTTTVAGSSTTEGADSTAEGSTTAGVVDDADATTGPDPDTTGGMGTTTGEPDTTDSDGTTVGTTDTGTTDTGTTDTGTTDAGTTDAGTTDTGSGTTAATTGDVDAVVAVSLGDGQTGFIDQQLISPIVITVHNDMAMAQSGVQVDIVAPPGAFVEPDSGVTDMNGEVVVIARVGRAIGDYTYQVNVQDGPSTSFSATAVAPTTGMALTLVNVEKVLGDNLGVPGPGTAATVGDVQGVDIATDDTIFFTAESSGNGYVYALDAVGELTLLAGGGLDELEECIDPLTADLANIEDIVYDEPNNVLYVVAQYGGGWRVLTIDLDLDQLCTFAGGNEDAPAPQYGDGGLATAARLVGPGDISLSPTGAVFIADRSIDRIRQVELGVISEFMGQGDCSDRVALADCQAVGCEMAWDDLGNLFIDARICGTEPGGTTSGIMRIDPVTLQTEHIAGLVGGSAAEPVLSFFATLGGLGGLSFDEAGNLYVVEEVDHRVRRIDTTTWQIETVFNADANEGPGVDYTPSTNAQLDDPRRIAFSAGGDMIVADSENSAVRMVWDLGDTDPVDATLALVAGDTQNVVVDEQMSLFVTDIVDDTMMPLEGVSVHYVADDSGACVRPDDDLTDDSGFSATFGRPGLEPGAYTFRAEYDDIHGVQVAGSPVVISANAAAPADDDIITAVNVDHTSGNLGVPGAGTCARVGDVAGVSVTSDGGIYFADNDGGEGRIRLIDGDGHVVDVAGGGAASVDGVPALDADLANVRDVLFDEDNNRVFLTGTYGGASSVLRINLNSSPPGLFVFAGQATPLPGDGDDGLATAAHLTNATDIAFDPTNPDAVYVVDAGHQRIRRIESLVIEHVYGVDDGDCADTVALQNCTDCNLAFSPTGELYVFGSICGSGPGGNTPGIVRLTLDGSGDVIGIEHIAGASGGTLDWPGFNRLAARFDSAGGLLVGSDGDIYFVEQDGHRVGRIDMVTDNLAVVAGDGTQGASGDYGAAADARLNFPLRLDERASGELVIADFENAAVRLVWGAL